LRVLDRSEIEWPRTGDLVTVELRGGVRGSVFSRARANRSGTLGRRSTKESGELGCPRLEALPSRLQAQATDPATAVVLETTLIDFAGRGR
jgi:hypothetical protein